MRELMDDNGNVTYNICKLQSASHLGVQLLQENSDMQFLSADRIVRLETARLDVNHDTTRISSEKIKRKPSLLASMFSLKTQAEADPIR